MTTERINFSSAGAFRQRQAPRPDDYAPYHTFEAFDEGVRDYARNLSASNHYEGVYAQAYDRGLEYAMRLERFKTLG